MLAQTRTPLTVVVHKSATSGIGSSGMGTRQWAKLSLGVAANIRVKASRTEQTTLDRGLKELVSVGFQKHSEVCIRDEFRFHVEHKQ